MNDGTLSDHTAIDELEAAEEAHARRRRRRRTTTWVVLVAAALVLAGGAATAMVYLNSLRSSYEETVNVLPQEETFPEETERPEPVESVEEESDGQLNILLLGSDSLGGSGENENVPWLPNAGRADTIMWAHIPEERDSIQVMSIMRDTWVPIAGEDREAKINSAFSFGGAQTAVSTLENLFNMRIDHVAAVDMSGFQGLVNAMDGVTVNSPVGFTSRDGYTFVEGEQHMDPDQAISYVRERNAFPDSDYQRVANQQAFVAGVLNDVLSASTLSNPATLHSMVSSFAPHLTVDSELQDTDYLVDLAWSMRDVRGSDIDMFTLPNNGVGSTGSESIILADYEAFEEAGEAMREGTFAQYAEDH